MQIKAIYYSSHFEKAFKKLPKKVQKQADIKVKDFRVDYFNPLLKTHKLKGALKDYWSFSINHSYRILFEFIDDDEVGLIDIGTHSIY